MDRLKTLIFSYYREDYRIKTILRPLESTFIQRKKRLILIECSSLKHFEQVAVLLKYLCEPLSALAIAREIVLYVPGVIERTYPITLSFHSDMPR